LPSSPEGTPQLVKPLPRFLEIARGADWPHFPALKQAVAAMDFGRKAGPSDLRNGGARKEGLPQPRAPEPQYDPIGVSSLNESRVHSRSLWCFVC